MKRKVVFLLAPLLIIGALSACSNNVSSNSISSGNTSSNTSSVNSGTSSSNSSNSTSSENTSSSNNSSNSSNTSSSNTSSSNSSISSEEIKHQVNFYVDEKVVFTFETKGFELIEVPEADIKEGYTFVGWYLDNNIWENEFKEDAYLNKELDQDIDVYAYYKVTTYTVSFNTMGGSEISPRDLSVLNEEEMPIPTKENHTFLGWYFDEGLTRPVQYPFTLTENITLYASYKLDKVEVTYIVNDDGELTGIEASNMEEIILNIPEQVNGKTITRIAYNAFANNKKIVEVNVPDTVTSIAVSVFSNCENLSKVRLSSNLTYIADNCFSNCTSLKEIIIPEKVVEIRSSAFSNSGLESITFPDNLKEIWGYAFDGCANLKDVNLNKVRYLGDGVFQNCKSLKRIEIPSTVSDLSGQSMFRSCTSLNEIILPDNIAINSEVIYDTAYYNDEANWENGVLYLGNYLVKIKGTAYTSETFTIKEGTKFIADSVFYNVSSEFSKLTTINLPSSIVRIGKSSFRDLEKLATINFDGKLTNIGMYAFDNTAYVNDKSKYVDDVLYFANCLIKVDTSNISSEYTLKIKEGCEYIIDGELFNSAIREKVTKVEFPSTLKSVGANNFNYASLSELILPVSLESIGEQAFYFTTITSVNLGELTNLKSIGEQAFAVTQLTTVDIPSSVTYMGSLVFNHVKGLIINCDFASQPSTWEQDWAKTYSGTNEINWKKA